MTKKSLQEQLNKAQEALQKNKEEQLKKIYSSMKNRGHAINSELEKLFLKKK